MTVKILGQIFDPWQEMRNYQDNHIAPGKSGATTVFIGTMRDFNEGDTVTGMALEHYPGMTEKQLEKIVVEAKLQWAVQDVLVIHRVGLILPNEPIVLLAVWSAHRGDAFDACRYLIEALKTKAPFWKKEQLGPAGCRWLENNTNGYKSI